MKKVWVCAALGLAGCGLTINGWEEAELRKCGRDVECRRHIQMMAELKRLRGMQTAAAVRAAVDAQMGD